MWRIIRKGPIRRELVARLLGYGGRSQSVTLINNELQFYNTGLHKSKLKKQTLIQRETTGRYMDLFHKKLINTT